MCDPPLVAYTVVNQKYAELHRNKKLRGLEALKGRTKFITLALYDKKPFAYVEWEGRFVWYDGDPAPVGAKDSQKIVYKFIRAEMKEGVPPNIDPLIYIIKTQDYPKVPGATIPPGRRFDISTTWLRKD